MTFCSDLGSPHGGASLPMRIIKSAGVAICAIGLVVGGGSVASADSVSEIRSEDQASASCGAAKSSKVGRSVGVVQSCPKGKSVIYTVKYGPYGAPLQEKTVTVSFSQTESHYKKIASWTALEAPIRISSIDWEYV